MTEQQTKELIKETLGRFGQGRLSENAIALFHTIGYHSDKRIALSPNNAEKFYEVFAKGKPFNLKQALTDTWQSVDLLFQLTGDEIICSSQTGLAFDAHKKVDNSIIESYLFFAITLKSASYTRTQLSNITREVNKLFPMPVMILFRHGPTLTLAIIDRRLHKRDETKDVLKKVTLIKDIAFANPHRAHIEILYDLSLEALHLKHGFTNFVELHEAWRKTLDSSELNKRFFQEIANWYFWALDNVQFPQAAPKDASGKDAISVIRLLTRIIFCWFIKEKSLIPDTLFQEHKLAGLLKGFAPLDTRNTDSVYCKAILQNLFFATLNTEMDAPGQQPNRRFSRQERDDHMIHTVWRHERLIHDKRTFQALFKDIPFLNGGLFECLDDREGTQETRIDGFSDTPKSQPVVPDFLFFGPEHETDLSDAYGDAKYKRAKVRGLIRIFEDYKFTIEENTPIEEDVALDPELLGHVFENLLADYNPETGAVARKTTGSFYTPRVAVGYMVDEALLVYLSARLLEKISALDKEIPALEARLRQLFDWERQSHQFTPVEVEALINAINALKAIDIACGSGAFPMGLLLKLVWMLRKLDPGNERWKAIQLAAIPDANLRAAAERVFTGNLPDYTRKLYLIENCLYGVDIQPIAVQIAKLRFFISLVVEQKVDDAQPNRGVLALPNLETRIVAANSILGLKRGQLLLANNEVNVLETELRTVRHDYFNARRYDDKKKLRKRDREVCEKLAVALAESGECPGTDAKRLATWNPYSTNRAAEFFDPGWMFGVTTGFDISIGNPPYVRQEELKNRTVLDSQGKEKPLKEVLKVQYECFTGTADLYVYFFERSFQLLRTGGVLSFITSNKYFRAAYGERLRTYLLYATHPRVMLDFGDSPVFTAVAYPCIFVGQKIRHINQGDLPNPEEFKLAVRVKQLLADPDRTFRVLTWTPGPPISEFPIIFEEQAGTLSQRDLKPEGWRLESPAVLQLLEKLRADRKPLGEYVKGKIYRGITTGYNEAFVIDEETKKRLIKEDNCSAEVIKPLLRGRDIKRYSILEPGLYLIYVPYRWTNERRGKAEPENFFKKELPAIHAHLKPFEKPLKKRDDQGEYWWEMRPCKYLEEFVRPKIIIPVLMIDPIFTFDSGAHYTLDTCYIIPIDSKYVLSILNSKVGWWVLRRLTNQVQAEYSKIQIAQVIKLPVATPTQALRLEIEERVEKVFAAKWRDPEADTTALERKIDQLVYELYGLTEDEIKIVEGLT